MRSSLIVLAEARLGTADAMTALAYLGLDPADADEPIGVRALVPCGTDGPLLTSLVTAQDIADLAAGDPDGRPEDAPPDPAEREAVMDSVVSAFQRVGCAVEATPCGGEPVASVRALLEDCSSQAVVVFSHPREDAPASAEDWAHRVEDHLSATVIHLTPAA